MGFRHADFLNRSAQASMILYQRMTIQDDVQIRRGTGRRSVFGSFPA